MKHLTYDKPHNARKLHRELIEGISGLQPIDGPLGKEAVFQMWHEGDTIHLTVPG